MALADDLTNLRNTKPRTFQQWREWADPADVELVLAAIMDRSIQPNKLAVTLAANNVPCTRETIVKMRDVSRD